MTGNSLSVTAYEHACMRDQVCSAHFKQCRAPPPLKQDGHDGSAQKARAQAPAGQLPRVFSFPRSREDAHHNEHDVQRAADVENLQDEVPPLFPRRNPEQIDIASAENDNVQELCEERYSFGGAVTVDGPDEDALGRGMGEIGENAEDVHGEHYCCWTSFVKVERSCSDERGGLDMKEELCMKRWIRSQSRVELGWQGSLDDGWPYGPCPHYVITSSSSTLSSPLLQYKHQSFAPQFVYSISCAVIKIMCSSGLPD
nr:hypothetical protein CFP56_73194 [Quercus suber]